jgi:DNA-binding CsgD family transcriptional regulator
LQLYAATNRIDEATELSGKIFADIEDNWFTGQIAAHRTMAEIAEREERYEEAEKHRRRALEIGRQQPSLAVLGMELSLAELLHTMGRDAEVEELLDGIPSPSRMAQLEQIRMLRLRAAVAERKGELERALEYERDAFAMERELLERRAEESLRNARIVADTELLEREAELERERRRRLEHELADAMVEISDRQRIADAVEQRLREALRQAGVDQTSAATLMLRETLSELRTGSKPHESPLRYMSGVDEEFLHRLRQRCPDLTSKQERLCALLRAGLGSKEISTLLGLGMEGLKAQRKRLRKRLGLSAEERLESVLAEM